MKNSILALLVLTSLGLWQACSSSDARDISQEEATVVKNVQTIPAQRVDHAHTVFASGQLASKEESRLSFKTGGIVKRILVEEGRQVRKGQLLAELDLEEIEAQVQQARLGRQQAEAQLENAKLGLEKAERDHRNVLGLYADSVATLEQRNDSKTGLDNAANQVEAADAGLAYADKTIEVAEFNLRYSRIVAPANGTILTKMAEVNELVGPGSPVFLFGSQEKAKVIRVNITDKDIIHLRLGNTAFVTFDAYPEKTFKGVVREIASKADPYTNTFEVEVEVDPAGQKLFSGFIGRVDIQTDRSASAVSIPVDALISADGDAGKIYVVEHGRVAARNIRILRMLGDRLLVRSGLHPGEEVVVEGAGYLENNDSVMISQR